MQVEYFLIDPIFFKYSNVMNRGGNVDSENNDYCTLVTQSIIIVVVLIGYDTENDPNIRHICILHG